jgi:hypothetical protein
VHFLDHDAASVRSHPAVVAGRLPRRASRAPRGRSGGDPRGGHGFWRPPRLRPHMERGPGPRGGTTFCVRGPGEPAKTEEHAPRRSRATKSASGWTRRRATSPHRRRRRASTRTGSARSDVDLGVRPALSEQASERAGAEASVAAAVAEGDAPATTRRRHCRHHRRGSACSPLRSSRSAAPRRSEWKRRRRSQATQRRQPPKQAA